MKKIAILGCENSHANSFLKFIKECDEFSDVEVFGIYSDDISASEKLNKEFNVPVMQNYSDAVGKIDGLVITARHGDNHYKFAKPYIKSGIPMFIDKPITITETDAVNFMKELKDNNISVSGGSSLKHDASVKELKSDAVNLSDGKTLGGYVRAPYQSKNDYGDFYFYSQHLAEIVCEIFGRFPISVTARQTENQIHVLFHYDKYDCIGLYCDNNYEYYASRMSEKSSKGLQITYSEDWFYNEFAEFHSLLHGGNQSLTYEEFISPVFIINAVKRSLSSGREEFINSYNI